jgi:hypothetical protein
VYVYSRNNAQVVLIDDDDNDTVPRDIGVPRHESDMTLLADDSDSDDAHREWWCVAVNVCVHVYYACWRTTHALTRLQHLRHSRH